MGWEGNEMPRIIQGTDFAGSAGDRHTVVVIGSGFGSLFYLNECLKHLPSNARVLVLERGALTQHHRQLEIGANATHPGNPDLPFRAEQFFRRPEGHKSWNFTIGLGGGTLCWWGQAPRLHPSDFRLRSLYGRGADWPISYDDIEPYYCEAEEIIGVAGDSQKVGPFHRSRSYPLPAFRGTSVDEAIRSHDPNQICLPAARDSIGLLRPQCCAFGNCRLCPHNSKFTALNGLESLLEDPRVTFVTGANVLALEFEAGTVKHAVVATEGKRRYSVSGEFFVLGANAIYNPAILMRSGLEHAELGLGITEQMGMGVEVKLTDLSGVDGGTSATGQNLRLIDGPHRKDFGAAAFYFDNRWKMQNLRLEEGKHLNTLHVIINVEELRSPEHRVSVEDNWDEIPTVHHAGHTSYATEGMRQALQELPKIFEHINVDSIEELGPRSTESHMQCSTPAGLDSSDSIVDENLLHHEARNLAVVGTSVFPSCPVGNPSLTAAAWSIRAARKLFSNG